MQHMKRHAHEQGKTTIKETAFERSAKENTGAPAQIQTVRKFSYE